MECAGILFCCFFGIVQESVPVRLSVVLHNQAGLAENHLDAAKHIVDGVFRHAGIEIVWQNPNAPSLANIRRFW